MKSIVQMTNIIPVQLTAAFRRLATLQRRVESLPDHLAHRGVEETLRALEALRAAQGERLAGREQIEAARAELRGEREKYQHLFDTAPQAYVVTDARLTILEANRAGAELFNISQRFLTGKGLSVYVARDRGRFIADAARLAAAGESAQWTFGIRPRERAPLNVDARVVAHGLPDGVELHWRLRPAN